MVSEINGPRLGVLSAIDQGGSKVDKAGPVAATPAVAGQGADVVSLTDLSARLQNLVQSVAHLPVADQEKIDAFRQSLADGSYRVDSQAVAEKMVALESLLAELPPQS